jgi:tRNA threonylcarbamoyladenosine biosynthesis protein TsaB
MVLIRGDEEFRYEWQADRNLARDMHAYLRDKIGEHGKLIRNIEGIGVYQGPGSFTGLRIGLVVLNTIADTLKVPIVGVVGADWEKKARDRLGNHENDMIVLPIYGAEANITQPRK